jgi:hypothetical protein
MGGKGPRTSFDGTGDLKIALVSEPTSISKYPIKVSKHLSMPTFFLWSVAVHQSSITPSVAFMYDTTASCISGVF